MIYKILKTNSLKSLNGTTALNMIALKNGAKILRVHDVKEAQECIDLLAYNQRLKSGSVTINLTS